MNVWKSFRPVFVANFTVQSPLLCCYTYTEHNLCIFSIELNETWKKYNQNKRRDKQNDLPLDLEEKTKNTNDLRCIHARNEQIENIQKSNQEKVNTTIFMWHGAQKHWPDIGYAHRASAIEINQISMKSTNETELETEREDKVHENQLANHLFYFLCKMIMD